jgi:hypothetical protein
MNELEWLAERRPETDLTEAATARARAALLEHARPPRRRRHPELLAVAAVLAIAIIVAAGALPSGDGRLSPAPASALVTLARKLHQAPVLPGDATLVHRSHHLKDGHDFTGVDLYLDDGRYFYGATDAELRQDTASGQDMSEGDLKREIAAALVADAQGGAAARTRMIDATYADGRPPTPDQIAAAKKTALEKLRAAGKKLADVKPVSQESMDDNRLWIGAMDALIAGGGRTDVRAGVMNLLSTVAAVHSERDGAVISITNTDFPDHYQETLIVGADSGVIEKMIGGTAGAAPDVVVTYDVKRVQASDWL